MLMINPLAKRTLLVLSFVVVQFCSTLQPAICHDSVDFGRDIRPILSDKCFACHGPDEKTREGGFRLDIKSTAFGETDSGNSPIVAGRPGESELVRRIMAHDDEQMPPADSDKSLDPNEIDLLKRWIAEGATWSEHWAFVTPKRISPPIVQATELISNPIDQFVIARLESSGISAAASASPETLIRRVMLDLTGLPPTTSEVDAFLVRCESISFESAYEELVDRLLDSPHYGEQMSSDWLDAARYADSNGYQNDFGRDMWPWRDWVIQSFNDNQPFDQFAIEQIAGDLLPDATQPQVIATGFNRNHRSVTEGGSIEEEWRVENVVDRVETTATVFLGLTMGCARCHDHKYDPISQREFYRFFAYFNSIDEKGFHSEKRGNVPPLIKVHSAQHSQKLAELDERIQALKSQIEKTLRGEFKSRMPQWRKEFIRVNDLEADPSDSARLSVPAGEYEEEGEGKNSQQLLKTAVGTALEFNRTDKPHHAVENEFDFSGERAFTVSAWVFPEKDGAIISRMDQAADYRGFDLLITANGQLNVHLIHRWPRNAIKITTESKIPFQQWSHVLITYDGLRKANGIKVYLNNRLVSCDVNEDSLTGSTLTNHPIWVGLRGATNPLVGKISRLHVFDSVLPQSQANDLFTAPLRSSVAIAEQNQSREQKKLTETAFRASFNQSFFELENQVAELTRQKTRLEKTVPTSMVLKERDTPRETYVLNRGLYDQPIRSEKLKPGVPAFLPQPDGPLPENRLGLARWLVDAENPLTARVAVNRFWQHYFGSGLLETPENFGVQSPTPFHQELLDWLAVYFVDSGWDVKALQKLIVMSSTYQQSSHVAADAYRSDPGNVLLARGPRFRLSAETIRDNALAISGLLNRKIGGPSIKPYQPGGLWKELAGGASQGAYVQDSDENIYRRSLYIYRKRTVPPPTMTTFDAGSREICQVARARTNTPLQALALLNDTTYVEASRCLAEKSNDHSENVEQRIQFAFRSATARRPSKSELNILLRAYGKFLLSFDSNPKTAERLIEVGDSPAKATTSKPSLAALTIICSMILNLDETITKE